VWHCELSNLDLSGEVHLNKLENVLNGKEAEEANLIFKSKICSLSLSWTYPGVKSKQTVELLLEARKLHRGLKELKISSYMVLYSHIGCMISHQSKI